MLVKVEQTVIQEKSLPENVIPVWSDLDVNRTTERLEIHLSAKLGDLTEQQMQVAGDRWINQHKADPSDWNYETCYLSLSTNESWVIVYTQEY